MPALLSSDQRGSAYFLPTLCGKTRRGNGWFTELKLPPADVMPCPQLVSDLFLKGDLLKAERFEQSNASWIRQGDTTEDVHESSCSKLGEQSTKELAADAPAHRRRSDVDGYLRGPPVRSAAIERRRIRESLRRIGFLVDKRCVTSLYSRCHLLFARRLSFERDHGVSDVGRIDRRKRGSIVFPSRPDHSLDCASRAHRWPYPIPSRVAAYPSDRSFARGSLCTFFCARQGKWKQIASIHAGPGCSYGERKAQTSEG